MQQITLREYNHLHPDRRGIWTSERTDDPNWEANRLHYMGKRTMMAGDGSCALLIEGLSFEITDYRRYLLWAGKDGAIIDIPYHTPGHNYDLIQTYFQALVRAEFCELRHLDEQEKIQDVYYHWELAGSAGASYELFQLPGVGNDSIESTETKIRQDHDVVRLKVHKIKTLHLIQPKVNELLCYLEPDRVREIIETARASATYGPWSDQLDLVMTAEERKSVKDLWNTMPGNTCFVDALLRMQ